MAEKKSFRKSQLIAFENVAAGHDGVLSDPAGEIVVKPCKQSEIQFYESITAHPALLPYVPNFMGVLSLGHNEPRTATSTSTAATATAQVAVAPTLVLPGDTTPETSASQPAGPGGIAGATLIENRWTPSNGGKIQTDLAIVLDNVAKGYVKPNILDVKLGARLWADDAPEEKKKKLDKVAEESTSKPLGYRIAGMKTYQGKVMMGKSGVRPDGYRFYDKMYGRGFTVESVADGFREYFLIAQGTKVEGPIRKVMRRFIGNLKEIQSVLEEEESRMYSASLLFVYEGDAEALQTAFVTEKDVLSSLKNTARTENGHGDEDSDGEGPDFPAIQNLKLIDFAHAEWTPGKGSDDNVLHGIRNLIMVLTDIAG